MDFGDKLGSVFENYIGRVVAFVLAPALLVAVPPVTNALNEVLGTGFSDQQIANVAIATCVGLAIVIWKWLGNRGDWETKMAELHQLYEAGRQEVEAHPLDGGDVPPPVVETGPKPTGTVEGKPGF